MNQAHGLDTELIAIEPYPNQVLKKGFPGLSRLIQNKVEEVDINLFSHLEDRDILFIDSSHVVRIGGDVIFLYLEVLPRLKKGVVVHIHDIFFVQGCRCVPAGTLVVFFSRHQDQAASPKESIDNS